MFARFLVFSVSLTYFISKIVRDGKLKHIFMKLINTRSGTSHLNEMTQLDFFLSNVVNEVQSHQMYFKLIVTDELFAHG